MPDPESCTATRTRSLASRCVRDDQLARAVARRLHGVQSVQEQVEHHLLQLHPVAEHPREIPGELGPESRPRPPRFALGQGDHLANDLIDVQRLLLGRRSAREGANPRDHVARPPAVAGDGLQAVAHFVEIRRAPRSGTAGRRSR